MVVSVFVTAMTIDGCHCVARADSPTRRRGIAGDRPARDAGELAPGDRLPTVRELAADARREPGDGAARPGRRSRRAGLIESRGRAGQLRARAPGGRWLAPRMRGLAGAGRPRCASTSRAARPTRCCCPRSGRRSRACRPRAETGSYQAEPVIPALATVLARLVAVRAPSRSWSSTARSTRISRTLEQVVRFGDRVVRREPRLPAVPRPARRARRRGGARARSTSTAWCPSALAARAARAARRRAAAAARAEPHRRVDDRRRAPRSWRGSSARPPTATTSIVIEDDHSGLISTAGDVTPRHLAARPGGARAQLLEVARTRPADRGARRAARARRPGRRAPHARPGLDLAHAADDPARPAHRRHRRSTPWPRRAASTTRGSARSATPCARAACRWRPPTASTCGCRCSSERVGARAARGGRHPGGGGHAVPRGVRHGGCRERRALAAGRRLRAGHGRRAARRHRRGRRRAGDGGAARGGRRLLSAGLRVARRGGPVNRPRGRTRRSISRCGASAAAASGRRPSSAALTALRHPPAVTGRARWVSSAWPPVIERRSST